MTMETLIWSNMNDPHNEEIIIKETLDLKNFVPVAIVKAAETNTQDNKDKILELIEKTYEKFDIVEMINDQHTLTSYLLNKFKSTDPNDIAWSSFKNYLQWILNISIKICNYYNLNISYFTNVNVQRSSYKFCEHKDKCYDVYDNMMENSSPKNKCCGDHFIHNKIVSDITILIQVLDKSCDTLYQDLRSGLNTLSFVLNHVATEMNSYSTYLVGTDFDINKYYGECICRAHQNRSKNVKKRYVKHH